MGETKFDAQENKGTTGKNQDVTIQRKCIAPAQSKRELGYPAKSWLELPKKDWKISLVVFSLWGMTSKGLFVCLCIKAEYVSLH